MVTTTFANLVRFGMGSSRCKLGLPIDVGRLSDDDMTNLYFAHKAAQEMNLPLKQSPYYDLACELGLEQQMFGGTP